MSENNLCIQLRIRLIERITEVDLPLFLLDQIEALLQELTYFKLMNLLDNIEDFLAFLVAMTVAYHEAIHTLPPWTPKQYAAHAYAPYFTDELYTLGWQPQVGLKDLLKLKQRFLVMVILSSKEYVYNTHHKKLYTHTEEVAIF